MIKTCAITESNLQSINGLIEKVDYNLFRRTFNDFLIMEGISPDVPIGMHVQMIQKNGIWQNGVVYTQYSDWEKITGNIWDSIRDHSFGEIYTCKN